MSDFDDLKESSGFEDDEALLDDEWEELEREGYEDVLQDCGERYRDERFRGQ